jgi:hypothetical protein
MKKLIFLALLTGCGGGVGVDLSGFQSGKQFIHKEGYPCFMDGIAVCSPENEKTALECKLGKWVKWGDCLYSCKDGWCEKAPDKG